MTLKLLFISSTLSLLLTACSFTNTINSFEDLYTDVKIVKPTSKNYKNDSSNTTASIIKDKRTSQHEQLEPKSVHIKKNGHITSVTYDPDLKLYLYTFDSQPEHEEVIFYYNQKLKHTNDTLLKIDVLDNYLISATPYHDKRDIIAPKKKKYIKHKKRNHNIREAIEEKINTF